MSVAVAVGFIALAGVAAETGVIMLVYLDHAMKELQAERAAEVCPKANYESPSSDVVEFRVPSDQRDRLSRQRKPDIRPDPQVLSRVSSGLMHRGKTSSEY
jgi:hypothetical protein